MFSKVRRYRLLRMVAALCGLLAVVPCSGALGRSDDHDDDSEIKLGRESAAEHDKTVKLISDPAMVERVNRIGQEIAEIANSSDPPVMWGRPNSKRFNYTFKVVDEKDVNAYSMPGGFIYVNKGTLEFAKSDDELAGVLAHEVAHAAHHHMMKLISEQNKMQLAALGPALVSVLLGKGNTDTTANLMLAGQLYMTAKLNSYGVEAEKDSDQAAVYYLRKTKYNPVGLLTFMERLARQERLRPDVDLGIYRTHPPSVERSQALVRQLRDLGIPINRREVDPTLGARVEPAPAGEADASDVRMNGTLIVRLTSSESTPALQRAQVVAKQINALFDDGLLAFEVTVSADKARVLARRRTLVAVSPADAAAAGRTVDEVTAGAVDAIRNLLWQDQFNRTPAPTS